MISSPRWLSVSRRSLRRGEVAARLGGDEFTLLLENHLERGRS